MNVTRKFKTSSKPNKRKSENVLAVNQYVDIGEGREKRRRIDPEADKEYVQSRNVHEILLRHMRGEPIYLKNMVWKSDYDIGTIACHNRVDNGETDFSMAASALHLVGDIYTNQVDDTHKGAYSLLSAISKVKLSEAMDNALQEKIRQRRRKAAKTLVENSEDLAHKQFHRTFNMIRYHHGVQDFEISKPESFLSNILRMDRKGNINLDRSNFFPFSSNSVSGNNSGLSLNNSALQTVLPEKRRMSMNIQDHLPRQEEEIEQNETERDVDEHVFEDNILDRNDIGIDIDLQINDKSFEAIPPLPDFPNEESEDDDVPLFDNLNFDDNNENPENPENEVQDDVVISDRDAFGFYRDVNLRSLPQLKSASTNQKTSKKKNRSEEDTFVDFSSYDKTIQIPHIEIENIPSILTQKEKTQQMKKKINKLNIISLNFDFTKDLLTPFNFSAPLDWTPHPLVRKSQRLDKSINRNDSMEVPELDPLPDFDDFDVIPEYNDQVMTGIHEEEFQVDRPEEITKLDIKFSTNSKKVDIASVKQSMQMAIEASENPSFTTLIQQARSDCEDPIENMSVGVNFICLLHLTNQYGYTIKQTDPFGDFIVMKSKT